MPGCLALWTTDFLGGFCMKKEIDGAMLEIPQHVAFILDGNGRWAKKNDFCQEMPVMCKEQK